MTDIFSVTELTTRIKDRLNGDARLHDLWARGELLDVKNYRSGHCYFKIKDKDSQLSCVLFRSSSLKLDFVPTDGQNVLVYGDIDVYLTRGNVQLIARTIRLDKGLGQRFLEFEKLKKKLASEGLFDLERKRPLPKYPTSIGIVTSPDGAALRDVVRIIGRYPARIIISPALVQGDGASTSIAESIRALFGTVDVVVVCRGGGSTEDLWAFNAECVARAIYECDCPVVTGVGHETDVTIADFVADVRAPTPTAAARSVVPDISELKAGLVELNRRMVRGFEGRLERNRTLLEYLAKSFTYRRMSQTLNERRQRLDHIGEGLLLGEERALKDVRFRLENASSRLSSVSPLSTLDRGYSLVRDSSGAVIQSTDGIDVGDILDVRLSKGSLKCEVIGKDDASVDNGTHELDDLVADLDDLVADVEGMDESALNIEKS